MEVAKLEMESILAISLMRYDFDLADRLGRFPNPLPIPNRNDAHQVRGVVSGDFLQTLTTSSRPVHLGSSC